MINWEIRGREIQACNCDYGCPCQFNSLPTKGNCEAVVGIQVDTGHFGDVKLDGVRVAAIMTWPKAIHLGHGKAQIIIDEEANPPQRKAMLRILSGQDTEPGATIFSVFAATLEEVFEPIFKPIRIAIDVDGRRGLLSVEGVIEAESRPILNPVTGQEHRVRIDLPNGFEYRIAEVASGTSKTTGHISFSFMGTHSHLAHLHMTQSGAVG